jgi:hypothetical protein
MKNKILIIITFLAGTMLFNSCLKDKLNSDWTSSLSGKMYAEFVNYGLTSFTINNGSADQSVKIEMNIASDAVPTTDITLTVAIDPVALAAYNTANGTHFVVCPNLVVPSVLVKAGTQHFYIYTTVKSANLLALTTAYVIPLTITAANGGGVMIAANKQSTFIQVPVANKWEGSYNMSSFILRAGDPVLSGNFRNLVWKLGTSGANSVTYWKTHTWGDGKSTAGGIGPWKLTIDESVSPNLVTVTDAANATLMNRPGYISRYVPATKTFYIGITWSTAGTREATDTLVYTGIY